MLSVLYIIAQPLYSPGPHVVPRDIYCPTGHGGARPAASVTGCSIGSGRIARAACGPLRAASGWRSPIMHVIGSDGPPQGGPAIAADNVAHIIGSYPPVHHPPACAPPRPPPSHPAAGPHCPRCRHAKSPPKGEALLLLAQPTEDGSRRAQQEIRDAAREQPPNHTPAVSALYTSLLRPARSSWTKDAIALPAANS